MPLKIAVTAAQGRYSNHPLFPEVLVRDRYTFTRVDPEAICKSERPRYIQPLRSGLPVKGRTSTRPGHDADQTGKSWRLGPSLGGQEFQGLGDGEPVVIGANSTTAVQPHHAVGSDEVVDGAVPDSVRFMADFIIPRRGTSRHGLARRHTQPGRR